MKYTIQDGDILLIEAFDLHRVFYNPHHEYTRYVIQFEESFLTDSLKSLQMQEVLQNIRQKENKKISLTIKQRSKLEEMFRSFLNLYRKGQIRQDDPTLAPVLKLHLLLILMEFHQLGKGRQKTRKSNYMDQQVQAIIQYIDQHYQEPIRLDDLAASLGKSKYYISHFFQETTKFTLVEYLQYRRIIEAPKHKADDPPPLLIRRL